MTAHTAVVFNRYMMLSLESQESNDNRSFGELLKSNPVIVLSFVWEI